MACRWDMARKKGTYDEETQRRANAKQALERYMHYFERFAENDKARAAVSAAAGPACGCRPEHAGTGFLSPAELAAAGGRQWLHACLLPCASLYVAVPPALMRWWCTR